MTFVPKPFSMGHIYYLSKKITIYNKEILLRKQDNPALVVSKSDDVNKPDVNTCARPHESVIPSS